MNYKETIEYLYSAAPAFEKVGAGAYKEGLQTTEALDLHFNHPHRRFKTIHVAGTNGKGSSSHTIAAILQSQGYRVGLYTSPHLVDFRERIRINGICIPEQYIIDFVKDERNFFEQFSPSFFELTTALAFKYFADEKIDVAVIEVGLGGRLDCTNIITPLLSVITNISFDHTQFLGNTLSQIAREKAGIIKPGVPCIVGEYTDETKAVFEEVALKNYAPVTFAQDENIDTDIEFELKGSYQAKNKRTILTAIRELRKQITVSDEAIRTGFSNVCELTGLLGRWQTLCKQPLTICDTGHNLAGWEYLAPQIKAKSDKLRIKGDSLLRMVFGMVDDKDIEAVAGLLPKDAEYYFCQASTHRAIPVGKLHTICAEHGLRGRKFTNVTEAYKAAAADANDNDFIFIGGSSYVVADLLTDMKQ